jgi:hypothetical protein
MCTLTPAALSAALQSERYTIVLGKRANVSVVSAWVGDACRIKPG